MHLLWIKYSFQGHSFSASHVLTFTVQWQLMYFPILPVYSSVLMKQIRRRRNRSEQLRLTLKINNKFTYESRYWSLPLGEGPKSRTMRFAESNWLWEGLGLGFEEDLEEERGSPSSSRLSVLSSLSICSSTHSSSDSSPAEPRLLRHMLTSRLWRKT